MALSTLHMDFQIATYQRKKKQQLKLPYRSGMASLALQRWCSRRRLPEQLRILTSSRATIQTETAAALHINQVKHVYFTVRDGSRELRQVLTPEQRSLPTKSGIIWAWMKLAQILHRQQS